MADEIRPSNPIVPTSPVTPPPNDKRRDERQQPEEQTADTDEADTERNDKDNDSGNRIDEYV